MSAFQNYFDENFLLSSTLKPKNSGTSVEAVDTNADSLRDEKTPVELAVKEPQTKRVCIKPATSTVDTIANIVSPPQTSPVASLTPSPAPSSTSNANSNTSQSLSDQILQVRIKLQIYQKEYAHFVECANRSSLQIQDTLEELHRLVNLNFDLEQPGKSKILNLNDLASVAEVSAGNINSNTNSITQNVNFRPIPKNALSVSRAQIQPTPELTIKSVKHRPRAFPRKPRCLIFNSSQPSYSDLMLTSSLDGSVQLWSKSEQKIQSSIYIPSHLHKPFFVEDLCWDRQPTGILALGLCESANAPVNDDLNGSNLNRSDRQMAFLRFNNRDPFAAPKFISSHLAPHDRSISVVESWSSSKHPGDTSHFLTGGLDKAIFSWKVVDSGSSRDPEISVRELHRRHTSSVQAICYDWDTSDIWSGGTDCRLVQWSGQENRLVNEIRWENRISHLMKTKMHPNLMLATVMSMSSQMKIFDSRTNSVVHSFGTQETANLSRYVRPSWHPNGNLITNGTLSPADSVGSINIWDLRMMKNTSNSANLSGIKPVRMINCEDRRLVRAEFAPDGQSLVGMSTDGFMTFVDFTCS